MKLLTIIAFTSVLSNSTPMMPSIHSHVGLSTWMNRIHAVRILPALDYFFFAA